MATEKIGNDLQREINKGWSLATRSDSLFDGKCYYKKIGNTVLLRLADIASNTDLPSETVLFSGLPTGTWMYFMIFSTSSTIRVNVNTSGQLCLYVSTLIANNVYAGSAMY